MGLFSPLPPQPPNKPNTAAVLKLYSDITVCFYSEDYTDEELTQLALQIEKLYDEELIANNTPDQYQKNLRWDIKTMKDKNLRVTSYSILMPVEEAGRD
mgnify:CR=1 FL=1